MLQLPLVWMVWVLWVVPAALGGCRAWAGEAEPDRSQDSHDRTRWSMAAAMGQEAGEHRTAAVSLPPTIPKTDSLLVLDLQGHRGARGLAPENTLAAFATALSLGVTTLELDTAITRDGVVVVSHDPALNPMITRGPDGAFLPGRGPRIRDLTFDELQRYDVGRLQTGTRYAGAHPEQKPVDGARIPKLADVFALVKRSGNTAVRLAIETKVDPRAPEDTWPPAEFVRRVIAEIRAAGMAERCTIQSFDWRTLQVVQREAPEIHTVYLTARQSWLDTLAGDPSPWTAGWRLAEHGSVPRLIHAAGGRIWSSYFGDLDAAQVQEAKALNLTVLAWTVNAPGDIARMLDLGVHGIISDRPDRVRAEMAQRGMPLPPATPTVP